MYYSPDMIAPCGINCGTCMAFLRKKNACMGCRSNTNKPYHCVYCVIANCEKLRQTTTKFCYECPTYPCARLKRLDKRYITRYHLSLMDNLNKVRDMGMDLFIEQEEKRWKCPYCGEKVCVHNEECISCHKIWRVEKTSDKI